MSLSGEQRRQLAETLQGAFNMDELRQILRLHPEWDLDSEVPTGGPFSIFVLEVVELAVRRGRAAELVKAARDKNPGNDKLRVFAETYLSRGHEGAATTTGEGLGPGRARVVARGLQSFDEDDKAFFPDLLPGQRDVDGLPVTLSFWKKRVEEADAGRTFRVGVLYGPSGCGKSSLMKAGLLPRLSPKVLPLYVEAAPGQTEDRLLAGLRRHCPDLPAPRSLTDAFAALRAGQGLSPGRRKVLVVLDQFEQWLHGRGTALDGDLLEALKQCDGSVVQAIVMVRADFWIPVTRFLAALEIRFEEDKNAKILDLFPQDHARRVLAEFGRAYNFGKASEFDKATEQLSESASLTREQERFLDQAVKDLADSDGLVVPVGLALLAQLFEGLPWEPGELNRLGGATGVGVKFLDQKFSATTAPPPNRKHKNAAQEVLKALLPEARTDIKGHMRTREQLAQAAGYERRPNDFEELLNILENQLKLVKPVDRESARQDAGADEPVSPPGSRDYQCQYYQLTHDYLVPALRRWLTRKQRETLRGRAGLALAERSAEWNSRPAARSLPAWWEWLYYLALTRRKGRTDAERRMLRSAARYHTWRIGLVLVLFAVATWAATELVWRQKAQQDADNVMHNLEERQLSPYDVPDVVPTDLSSRAATALRKDLKARALRAQAANDKEMYHRACIALALLDGELDDDKVRALCEWMLGARESSHLRAVALVLPKVGNRHRDLAVDLLQVRLKKSPATQPSEQEDAQAQEQANAAAALLRLDRQDLVWPHLSDDADPGVRAYLILRLRPLGGDWRKLRAALLSPEADASRRRALILGLGVEDTMRPSKESRREPESVPLTPEDRKALVPHLRRFCQTEPDPGARSAAEWLLRQWDEDPGQPPVRQLQNLQPDQHGRGWYTTARGEHTMVVLPPSKSVPYRFAISTKEVTIAQFKEFKPNFSPEKGTFVNDKCPATTVKWTWATKYCDSLSKSKQEGLIPFYEAKDQSIPGTSDRRARSGYRLPTVQEWRYACGEGDASRFYPGKSSDLLERCAWCSENGGNKLQPVGKKWPNELGLFDMLGNASEWCHDLDPSKDEEDDLPRRRRLGGSILTRFEWFQEKSPSSGGFEVLRTGDVGFRIVRTMPDD
jgi:hypothetical protein